jgi:hypothetical protein
MDNITGAIIGVLSALLTFILTSWYQWLRDERDRKWRLEDMKLQRRLNALNLRLSDVQRYLNEKHGIILSIYEMEYKLLNFGLGFDAEAVFNKLSGHYKNSNESFSSIFNLSDPDLTQLNIKLTQLILNEQNEYKRLGEKISNKEVISKEQEEARINKFFSDASGVYYSLIKRVDELSGLN